MGRRRREIVLAALAAVIIAVAVYRVRSVSPAADAAEHSRGADAAKQQAKALTELDLQALSAPRPEPVDSSRDPFRFKPKPPPPAPPAPSRQGTTQLTPTQPVGPPPPAPIPLKFIGTAESKQAGRVAILSDARGVYYGHEGEIVEGRYRILRIGVESIDLAYVDGRGRQTIRQTGQ